MLLVDLNCDMGEGIGNDAAIMPYISSANIACGFHAGDDTTMRETVGLAMRHGVSIGAHPSFPDRENFGRMVMPLNPKEVYALTISQIEALHAIVLAQSATLKHVKPHGALYNLAAVDEPIANAIAQAIRDFNPQLTLFGLANSYLTKAGYAHSLKVKHEVFADRTYQPKGTLTPRTEANALIETEIDSIKQVMQMLQKKTVTAIDGTSIPIQADTICIHGDGTHAVQFAKTIHARLKEEGFQIKSE